MFGRFVMWFVGVAAVLALGSLGGGGTAAGAQPWSEYRPAGGGFRVEMPGTPTVAAQNIDIAGGRVATQVQATLRWSKADYTVAYMDYPPDIGHGVPPERLLERARDSMARQGELRSDAALTVYGLPAREFVVATNDNLTFVMRVVWSRNRLFRIVVLGFGSDVADRPATRRFLNSFALVKP